MDESDTIPTDEMFEKIMERSKDRSELFHQCYEKGEQVADLPD